MGFARGSKLGRVLLVEGSAPLQATLSEYFRERGIDTYAAYGMTDARALLAALKPDATTLDLDLEDGDPFDLIEDIGKAGSRCLVLSARDQPEDRIRALSMGADDFLAKPVEIEEIYLRIRNILANRRTQNVTVGSIIDLHGIKVDLVTRALLGRDMAPGAELTEMELSLLQILTDNIGRVVSKEALFENIHGRPYTSNTRSLDVSISRLRIKLKSIDAGAEIRSVRQAGYILSLQ
jgi:two-component system, OmpR family, response regulator